MPLYLNVISVDGLNRFHSSTSWCRQTQIATLHVVFSIIPCIFLFTSHLLFVNLLSLSVPILNSSTCYGRSHVSGCCRSDSSLELSMLLRCGMRQFERCKNSIIVILDHKYAYLSFCVRPKLCCLLISCENKHFYHIIFKHAFCRN